jgi:putative metal-binding protein
MISAMAALKLVVLSALLALTLPAPARAHAAAPDGAFLSFAGSFYRVIGGAALRVGSCAPLGGCTDASFENPANYPTVPRNGTFIRVPDGSRPGLIARVAGGHPFWQTACAEVAGGCADPIALDSAGYEAYEAAHPTVADGAFVRRPDGLIARAAGGALLGLGSCAPVAGCPETVNVDTPSFQAYGEAHPTVADGTFIRRPDGLIARAVGGALLGLGSCARLADCAGWVQLDDAGFAAYTSVHPVVANGAFVRVLTASDDFFARAAGGRLLVLTDCSVLAGCPKAVDIDLASSNAYQNAHPLVADGTILRGLPSGHLYRIDRSVRTTTASTDGAVEVNDATLAQFVDGDRVTPPVVLSADADGDGVTPPLDCNDARADVRPGVSDVPGDGVDQDCSGTDATYPKLDLLVGAFFNTRGRRTDLTSFYVRSVPAGTKLTLRCSGKGCPFKSTSVTVKAASARFSLLPRMRRAKLRSGARLELQLTHAGMIGKVIRWTIRTSKAPRRSNLCLAPGAEQPTSCSRTQ